MDVIIGLIICFFILIYSVLKNIFIFYPLMIGLTVFFIISLRRGYKAVEIVKMALRGGKKSFLLLHIFVIIGVIISSWMAAGTVPAIVFYGLKLINSHIFILSTFLLSAFISFLIGTSFGTIGTVGMALIVMARGGGVCIPMTAGAILSGAYFGDRCSPMSSSANLVASLTATDLYTNIKNMFKTSIIPFGLTCLLFGIFSLENPLNTSKTNITFELAKSFNINPIVLIPAGIILVLSLFKLNVKLSMWISTICAVLLALFFQHYSFVKIAKFTILGFQLDKTSPLASIMSGGGVISMLKVALIVYVSSAFTGIFEGTGMLIQLENLSLKAKNRRELFTYTIFYSLLSAAFGCTQTIAVILAETLMKKAYDKKNVDPHMLALDIENSAIVVSALVPWNIAALVPLTTLNASFSSIFYSFYLIMIPLINLVLFWLKKE